MFESELKSYLKYYNLEDYLFKDVHDNFHNRNPHYLTAEEFFAIIFWKRKASAFTIVSAWGNELIENITGKLRPDNKENNLNILIGIHGVGIAIASAILTVCYPDDFTVIDRKVLSSLERLEIKVQGDPEQNTNDYLEYISICKTLAKKFGLTLRNLDRALWGMDSYGGEKGLLGVVGTYNSKLKR